MATPQRTQSDKEDDIQLMLAVEAHLATKNCDSYVFKRHNNNSTLFLAQPTCVIFAALLRFVCLIIRSHVYFSVFMAFSLCFAMFFVFLCIDSLNAHFEEFS